MQSSFPIKAIDVRLFDIYVVHKVIKVNWKACIITWRLIDYSSVD